MPHTQTHYLCLVQFSVRMCSDKACNNSLFTYIRTNVVSRFKIGHQEFPAQLNPLHVQYAEPHSFPSSPPVTAVLHFCITLHRPSYNGTVAITSLNILKVTATNVTPTSKICATVLLLLLTAVHWLIKYCSILQWYNIDIKFRENQWNYKKFKMEFMGPCHCLSTWSLGSQNGVYGPCHCLSMWLLASQNGVYEPCHCWGTQSLASQNVRSHCKTKWDLWCTGTSIGLSPVL
jgi:hypothetical protein